MSKYGKELAVMRAAALEASAIQRGLLKSGLLVVGKSGKGRLNDHTVVTQADLACERAIQKRLLGAFPTYGFYGEETGGTLETKRRFIVDPVDGTANYSRDLLGYGALIGLEVNGEIVAGAFTVTPLGQLFWAEKGRGAFLNGKRLHVSKIKRLSDAVVSVDIPSLNHAYFRVFKRLLASARLVRVYGNLLDYSLLAQGKLDGVVHPMAYPYDLAALKIVVEEAGGTLTNQRGVSTIYGVPAHIHQNKTSEWTVASNGKLHSKLLRAALGK